ncbi:MAG TPA: 3'-5' exonuclease [Burkholderiales bacterium]|nr:3'-5' exonuclease [Burkholderiales bacterium]
MLPYELQRTISREEVNRLPVRCYEGEIRVPATPAELKSAMDDIRSERVLGFDTETRPAFQKGEHHPPCLVQAATARAVYLFPLQRMDFSAAVAEFLGARQIVKVGVSLAHDLRQLKLVFPFEEASILDAGATARQLGLEQTGLRNLAALFLGFRIPKGNRTSNWAARRLSAAQIRYAATDAWACRELYFRFEELGVPLEP